MRGGVRGIRSGGGEDDGLPVAAAFGSSLVVGGCHGCFAFCLVITGRRLQ